MKGRRKIQRQSRVGRSTSNLQSQADDALIQTALAEVAQNEAIVFKQKFEKEILIELGGDNPKIMDVLRDYDAHTKLDDSQELREPTIERKEAIAAMKVAQQRLELEIKKDQQQREQLKLSQDKQVRLALHTHTAIF